MKPALLAAAFCAVAFSQSQDVMRSSRAAQDVAPDPNPNSSFWRSAPAVFAAGDTSGKPLPKLKTEIRSRWTKDNLYLLFICPYEELYLKPSPDTTSETNKLWDWDVAEAFIGSDFQNIRRYKEFEVSPQGEWVDLDINRDKPSGQPGVTWNSNLTVASRIDRGAKIWYSVMKIPYNSIDTKPAAKGNTLRINLYRQHGHPPERDLICWRPTQKRSFHVPESFGTLELVDK